MLRIPSPWLPFLLLISHPVPYETQQISSRFLFHKRSDFCLPHFLSRRPSAAGTDPALLGGLLSSAPWPRSSVNLSPSQNFYSITRFPEIDNCSLFSLPYQIHPFLKIGTWYLTFSYTHSHSSWDIQASANLSLLLT